MLLACFSRCCYCSSDSCLHLLLLLSLQLCSSLYDAAVVVAATVAAVEDASYSSHDLERHLDEADSEAVAAIAVWGAV